MTDRPRPDTGRSGRIHRLNAAKAVLCAVVFTMCSPAANAAPTTITPAIPNAQDAPIALLIDLSSGQTLFARDIDRRFMPASMTKVMTVFTAFEWMHRGKLFPQQVITVAPDVFDKWHGVGSTMFLPDDARVTVDQLLHGITTVSANDGAAALAHGAAGSVAKWVAAMNREARSIGMTNSHYGTPNGWMDQGGTFVTARDLATLASAMIERYPDYYHRYFGSRTLTYNGITQRNHDPITGVVPGADGIKTGFTNQAGYGFLGSAARNGRRLVMVIATSPTGRQRNNAARSLIEWGFDAFDSRLLFGANTEIAKAKVQGGGLSHIKLVSPRPIRVDVPKGTHPKIALKVRYFGPLRAPLAKGEHFADLIVTIDGQDVSTRPLVSDRAVGTATIVQRIFNGFARWLA